MTRLAGLSGAAAIALGAYGAHAMQGVTDEQRKAFEVANRYFSLKFVIHMKRTMLFSGTI